MRLGLARSTGVGITRLIRHLPLFGFDEDLAVLDDGIAQEFHDDDENLQAALSDIDCLIKFFLGVDLLFELLVSLS